MSYLTQYGASTIQTSEFVLNWWLVCRAHGIFSAWGSSTTTFVEGLDKSENCHMIGILWHTLTTSIHYLHGSVQVEHCNVVFIHVVNKPWITWGSQELENFHLDQGSDRVVEPSSGIADSYSSIVRGTFAHNEHRCLAWDSLREKGVPTSLWAWQDHHFDVRQISFVGDKKSLNTNV